MEFKDSRPMTIPPQITFQSATRESPDFIVPAITSVILLTVCSAVAGVVVGLLFAAGTGVSVRAAWLAGALTGLCGFVSIGLQWHKMVFRKETIIGNPPPGPTPQVTDPNRVQIEVSLPDEGRWQLLELPGTPAQLEQLSRGLMGGRPFTESEWCGGGRLYSKPDFVKLRAELMERGVVEWRNPEATAQGVKLTAVGRAIFRQVAENARTHAHAITGSALLTDGRQE